MKQSGRCSTVFLVDDDPSVRKALTRLIKVAGYQVEAFASARDFLEWRNRPDRGSGCLILDVRMPGLSGLDLQQQLLATHAQLLPRGQHQHVITAEPRMDRRDATDIDDRGSMDASSYCSIP